MVILIVTVAVIVVVMMGRHWRRRKQVIDLPMKCRKLLRDALLAASDNELRRDFAKDGSEWIHDGKLPDALRLTTHNEDGGLQITLYDIAEKTADVINGCKIIPNGEPSHVTNVLRELDIVVDDKFIKSLSYNNAPQCVRFYRAGKGRWSILTNVLAPKIMAEQVVDILPLAKGGLESSASPNFATRRYFSTIGQFVVTTVREQEKYQPVPEVVLSIWAFVWLASSDESLRSHNLKLTLRNLDGLICIDVRGAKRDEVRQCAEIINSILDELATLEIVNSVRGYCDGETPAYLATDMATGKAVEA